jgi:hypothetical protein
MSPQLANSFAEVGKVRRTICMTAYDIGVVLAHATGELTRCEA